MARTNADNQNVSVSALQAQQVKAHGSTASYRKTGLYTGGQSYSGAMAEKISAAGNAVVGRTHRKRWEGIRKSMGLSFK